MTRPFDMYHSDAAENADRSAASAPRAYRVLWPLGLLILAQIAMAIALFEARTQQMTPLSTFVASFVLLVGLVPAIVRPASITNLMGCFAVLLVSGIWHHFGLPQTPLTIAHLVETLEETQKWLSLGNVAFLMPLMLHIASTFSPYRQVPGRVLGLVYTTIAAQLIVLRLLPSEVRIVALLLLALTIYSILAMAARVFLRVIRDTRAENIRVRQQARLLLVILTLAEAPLLLLPIAQVTPLVITHELILGAQMILPLGIQYAVVRHDLFGIDAALRRAARYAVASTVLLALYFGVTIALTQMLQSSTMPSSALATIVGVLVAAATFTPVHRRAQALIDRAFYPERVAFRRELREARTTLARVVHREEIVALLTRHLPERLDAHWAKLLLRPSFAQPMADEPVGTWQAPLVVGGQVLGYYWLGPRRSGVFYDADEQQQLHALVQQAALALAYAATVDALTALNQELEERVATRTEQLVAQQRALATVEERQRLARDLHDSVKQTLFSLGLGLRVTRSLLPTNAEQSLTMLQQQEQMALQAQAEMSELLAQLRTPSSELCDLTPKIEQYCEQLRSQGFMVALHVPTTLVLPEVLARELLLIAKEALHNARRHSGTKQAQLVVAVEQSTLTMTIADDGCGFAPATHASDSFGLRSMQERAAAIGASFVVQSTPGVGTRVCLQLVLKS
jgi:signal transduction histidine kinase